MQQPIRLENYVPIREHHSQLMNDHFIAHLESFAMEYEMAGGDLSSVSFQMELEQFAESTAMSLLEASINDPGNLTRISTETEFKSASTGRIITIESKTVPKELVEDFGIEKNFHLN